LAAASTGHNSLGITLPGESPRYFDLWISRDVNAAGKGYNAGVFWERPLYGTGGRLPMRPIKSTVVSFKVPKANAQAALNKAVAMDKAPTPYPAYNKWSWSCTTTVADVAKVAGIPAPWWAKSPKLLEFWYGWAGGQKQAPITSGSLLRPETTGR
jgi:hypothetical protein